MWELDDEAAADVVGTASARLLAAGVPREERLGALRLLGVLSASADSEGIVRRGFADLLGEFDLDPGEATRWLDHLVHVQIVQRGIGVLLLAGVEPPAAGGLRLADFLATAAAVDDPYERPVRRRPRILGPVHALAAAAAVIAAMLAVPLLDRGTSPDSLRAAADRPEATTTAQDDERSTTLPSRRTTTTDVPDDAPLPVVVPTTTTTVATTCPAGQPLLEVLGVTEDDADRLASVEGVARNLTGSDMLLEEFTVSVVAGDEVMALPGLQRPLTLPAGESVRWSVRTPVPAVPGIGASAVVDGWRWSDDSVASACH